MRRRTLLRAGGAAAGVLAAGGIAAWVGLREDPSVPGATAAGRRWRVQLADQPDVLQLAGETLLALGSSLTAFGAADGTVRWQDELGRNTLQTARAGDLPVRMAGDAFVFRTQDRAAAPPSTPPPSTPPPSTPPPSTAPQGTAAQVRVAGLGDGKDRWRRAFPGYVGDVALVDGKTVVTVADGTDGRALTCFGGPTDTWRQALQATDGPFDLHVAGGTVYAAARELAAHDAGSGTRKWAATAPDGQVFGRPVVLGALVVALGMRYVDDDYLYRNESLHAFDAATGQPKWSWDAPDGFLGDGAPLLTGRGIVAVHESGRLTGLDQGTGAERWHYDWDFADITSLGDTVYIATTDGVAFVDPVTGQRTRLLDEPNAYKLAGDGKRLCVAAGETLSGYDV
ncbi:PQQ-binding-like beta-propeller repeat protein [Dactylosporangium sp. CS-033363]|uniref:outer membrane protein assembly factor BamB family protein n=1 Tax=Dactylosporangium sp. CS-033363 TaxID=3239935 RepID=UPI003D9391BD